MLYPLSILNLNALKYISFWLLLCLLLLLILFCSLKRGYERVLASYRGKSEQNNTRTKKKEKEKINNKKTIKSGKEASEVR